MQKLNDKEYVYISSLLLQMIPPVSLKDETEKLSQLDSLESLSALMNEEKLSDSENTLNVSQADIDERLSAYLERMINSLKASAPDPGIYDFLLFKYDCNNIKTAIKCRIRNINDEGMYFPYGTVDAEEVRKAADTRDFSCLPANMANAAKEACDEYERTGESRIIDLLLDRASFADMKESVSRSGIDFFDTYLKFISDRVNFSCASRISETSLSDEAKASLYKRTCVMTGSFDPEVLCPGEELGSIGDIIFRLPLGKIKSAVIGITDPDEIGKALDIAQNGLAEKYSNKPFGPEVPAYCLMVSEERIRRFRKAASYISRGRFGRETIKEELY